MYRYAHLRMAARPLRRGRPWRSFFDIEWIVSAAC
jgi:hypothetical protein